MPFPNVPVASTVIDSILFRDCLRHAIDARDLFRPRTDRTLRRSRGCARPRRGALRRDPGERCRRKSPPSPTRPRSTSTSCAAKPRTSATRSCRSCIRWSKQCGEAGRYVHWGATTQDIMDTAIVLQIRAALDLVDSRPPRDAPHPGRSREAHRDTPMAGRTHLQQALPITFGYKAAIWRAMFDRHAERLTQLRPRVLVVEFAGAAGTLASLGDRGLDVQAALADELGLAVPASTWHVARDGFAEAVNLLGLDHRLARQDCLRRDDHDANEVGEALRAVRHRARRQQHDAAEAQSRSRASSCSRPARPCASTRASWSTPWCRTSSARPDPWHAEWIAHTGELRAAPPARYNQAKFMLGGLIVDEARMRKNLDLTSRPHRRRSGDDGSRPAHRTSAGARHRLRRVPYREREGRHARRRSCRDPEIAKHLDRAAIERLTDPANYLGMAPQMVDRVLSQA